jgi:hypothetical protein
MFCAAALHGQPAPPCPLNQSHTAWRAASAPWRCTAVGGRASRLQVYPIPNPQSHSLARSPARLGDVALRGRREGVQVARVPAAAQHASQWSHLLGGALLPRARRALRRILALRAPLCGRLRPVRALVARLPGCVVAPRLLRCEARPPQRRAPCARAAPLLCRRGARMGTLEAQTRP